jgi:hypothetical protein
MSIDVWKYSGMLQRIKGVNMYIKTYINRNTKIGNTEIDNSRLMGDKISKKNRHTVRY